MFFNSSDVVIMTVSDFIAGVKRGLYQDTLGKAYAVNEYGYWDDTDSVVKPSRRGSDIAKSVEEIAWVPN